MIQITKEDNMDLMARYPDKYFDLAIVDPPYGININVSMGRRKGDKKSNYHKFAGGDSEIPNEKYFNELFRVSANQIVWGGNYMTEFLKPSPCWIVWDKDNGETDFADCELAWTSFNSAVRIFKWKWAGMLQQDMKNKENRIHPTQKPVALYKWLLTKYAKKGDKILDTHLGSGSIAIACHDLGFDLTACELDTDYFNSAMKRLTDHQKQLKLL